MSAEQRDPRAGKAGRKDPSLRLVTNGSMVRDGVYVRVSAVMGREDDRFLSPELQQRAINAARQATSRPSTVVKVWQDIDVSGRSMDRPDLNEALAWAREGRLDRLWIYDLSRWARCAVDGLRELEEIERAGCKVMSTAENVDLDSPEGYFSAGIFLLAAEMQGRKIGNAWRAAHKILAQRGEHHGRTPTGYMRADNPDGGLTKRGRPRTKGPLLVDPELGPLITKAFEQYAREFKSITIIKDFNAATDRVKLDYDRLCRILDNPVYVGLVSLNGQLYPGAHEPLVEINLWEKARARRTRDARIPSRRKAIAHPLVGLLRCSTCGWSLTFRRVSGKSTSKEQRFDCRRHSSIGLCEEGVGSPSAIQLETAVLEKVRARVYKLRTTAAEQARSRARQTRARIDHERVERELTETMAARDRLALLLARGKISEAVHQRSDEQLQTEEAALREQMAELGETVEATSPEIAVERMNQLLQLWPAMTIEEQNRALRAVVKHVMVRRAAYRGEPTKERIKVTFY